MYEQTKNIEIRNEKYYEATIDLNLINEKLTLFGEFNSLELIASKNLGVKAPINKDDVLDSLDFVIDGKTLKSIDLVAVKKIDSKGFLSSTFEAIGFYIYSFFMQDEVN